MFFEKILKDNLVFVNDFIREIEFSFQFTKLYFL